MSEQQSPKLNSAQLAWARRESMAMRLRSPLCSTSERIDFWRELPSEKKKDYWRDKADAIAAQIYEALTAPTSQEETE